MRKITINLAAVAAFCIVVASPALVSSSCATPKTEQEDTTYHTGRFRYYGIEIQ